MDSNVNQHMSHTGANAYSECIFHELFDHVNSCVAIYEAVNNGENFKFVNFNKAAERAEQVSKEAVVGKNVTDVFPAIKEFGLFSILQRVWQTGKPEIYPVTQYHDERISGWRTNYIFKLPHGEIVAVYEDLTAEKKQSEKLEKAREDLQARNKELEESDKVKSQFVANVSHEFKTPLAIIKNNLDIVLDGLVGDLAEKQKVFLERSRTAIDRLVRLTTDILDISRIEAGKMDLRRQKIHVLPLIDEVLSEFEYGFTEKNIELKKDKMIDVGVIWGDRDRLHQVFYNLVSNALKYTPNNGWVEVECANHMNHVCISIADSGPGIATENIDKVFNKFERVIVDKKDGTGLGLPIAMDLVQLHQGNIELDSDVGEGSRFIVSLPRDLRDREDDT
jgi:two-component system, sensor histidine kinase and response regulator